MVRAYARWDKIGAYDNPGGWVYRVGLNWARSARRRFTACAPVPRTARRRPAGHRSRALRRVARPRHQPARGRGVPPAARLVGRRDRRRTPPQARHGEEPSAPRPRPTRTNPWRSLVNAHQLDQLRDALRRETATLQPVGLGVEDRAAPRPPPPQPRPRARRGRRPSRASPESASSVSQRGPGGKHVVVVAGAEPARRRRRSQFRVVDGTVSYASTHFTTSGGVTYALSTAPGVAAERRRDPGQAIYSTEDGEHWTTPTRASRGSPTSPKSDGVLYAIGTAPGRRANDVTTASARRTTAANMGRHRPAVRPEHAERHGAVEPLVVGADRARRGDDGRAADRAVLSRPRRAGRGAYGRAPERASTQHDRRRLRHASTSRACMTDKQDAAPCGRTAPTPSRRKASSGKCTRARRARHDQLVRPRPQRCRPTSPARRCS